MSRPDWDNYFLKIAFVTAERSTCIRHHVGAVMVQNRRILSGGYNGAPSGLDDCLKLGCLRNEFNILSGKETEVCRAVHAEENAMIQGAIYGLSLKGSTIYCTHSPCRRCAKMLCNLGIKRFVTCFEYDDSVFADLFKAASISFYVLPLPTITVEVLK